MKIKLRKIESFSSYIVKEIEIETDFPIGPSKDERLNGLTKEEIQNIIGESEWCPDEVGLDFGPDGDLGEGNVVKHETFNEQTEWEVE